jgi:hypothetical protein
MRRASRRPIRIEILHFGCDLSFEPGRRRVEGRHARHAALARDEAPPEFVARIAERGNGPHARDHDPSFLQSCSFYDVGLRPSPTSCMVR